MDDLPGSKQQSSARVDISELIVQLQHEKLLVNAEKRLIETLNEKLGADTEELLRIAWINFQQRVNLNALVGPPRPDCSPEQCCRRAANLANSLFIEAKEVLDYQVIVNYSDFLSCLRTRPELVAQWIVIGEALSQDQISFSGILHSIVAGLYGSVLLPQDSDLLLHLLQYLARLQLVTTDNPRRLLKQGSCAFSRMYFLYHECLTSAKLFLISSLQGPVLQLIANSDCYLDIDPNKTVLRFTQEERLEKFGIEGTEDYKSNVNQYRKWVVKTLTDLTKAFISSIQDNVYCFPSSLGWLIRQIAGMISKSFSPHSKEINAISTDLIFTLFICPALVQPEPYGICDAPVSEIARHNLIQVGQILQMLALLKFENTDMKLTSSDVYNTFETDCVSNILDIILNHMESSEDEMPLERVAGVHRNVALFTERELYNLIMFLKKAQNSITQEQSNTGNEASCSDYCNNNGENTVLLPDDPLVVLLNKLPTDNEGSPRNTLSNNTSPTNASKKHQLLHKAKSHLTRTNTLLNGDCEHDLQMPTTVLVIPLRHENESEHIGLIPEEKFLALNSNNSQVVVEELLIDMTDAPSASSLQVGDTVGLPSGQEKRTRFSNNNDEGSIGGNTSDNLEVISEAASNHSVASSIELEENEDQNDNDNLSDMVSANVSGRGTPNISGRDTPSSQVTENEDNPRPLVEVRPPYLQQPQPLISKQIGGSEIEDKFCKFEIKKLLEGDETISIISDTWSTDVLASDSETIDASESRHEPPTNFPSILEQSVLVDAGVGLQNPLLDVSETQSESAWSTDVLASDTERLTEVDNDDAVSVAPSDDPVSVARSDDAASVAPSERSETDEQNLNDNRRLSTASSTNQFMSFQSSQNNSPSSTSAFQEYRRSEVVAVRRESMPNYIISSKSESHNESHVSNASSFERSMTTFSTSVETSVLRPFSRNCTDSSKREAMHIDVNKLTARPILSDISNSLDSTNPGPSGVSKSSEASYILVKNVVEQSAKYEDIKTDMQLSNTSLNSSSSSGSSNGSERARNKNGGGRTDSSWKNKVWLNGSESNLSLNTASPLDQAAGKKVVTPTTSRKSSSSTGAIPKSISFDMSAEKGDKDDDDSKNKQRGFFGKLRMNFRPRSSRGSKSFRGGGDEYTNGSVRFDPAEDDLKIRSRYSGDFPTVNGKIISPSQVAIDPSEDILEKYRPKPTASENGNTLKTEKTPTDLEPESRRQQQLRHNIIIDTNSLFNDAKKKLRLVLSHCKTQVFRSRKDGRKHVKKDLESFLQIELAKAKDLMQWSRAARVSEALRCVRLLDIAGFNRLCENLRDEHCDRSIYLKYLLRSKQTLLSSQTYLQELFDQVERDKELCSSFLISVCVRLFLERNERQVRRFCEEFKKLTLVDEKNDHLATFLNGLFKQMRQDPLWHDGSDEQIQMAQLAIERSVMTEVYVHALYPNGDGDRHRDSVLNEHLKKLSSTITPGHKYLLISEIYRNECPWLPAQEALQAMAAYKTPRDKLSCVTRCAKAIVDLLSLAQGSSATADDLVPVIVYVIIKANPQDLLSTIQYVNSFYGNLSGEEGYWWTQFCSAVEYTKTMEYTDD